MKSHLPKARVLFGGPSLGGMNLLWKKFALYFAEEISLLPYLDDKESLEEIIMDNPPDILLVPSSWIQEINKWIDNRKTQLVSVVLEKRKPTPEDFRPGVADVISFSMLSRKDLQIFLSQVLFLRTLSQKLAQQEFELKMLAWEKNKLASMVTSSGSTSS